MCANNKYAVVVLALCALGLAWAEDAAAGSDRSDFKRSFAKDCANTYSTTCLKLDIVSWVDKLSENDDYSVLPGVSVVRENGSARANSADVVAELARDFPNDPDARLDAFLMNKVTGYLNSHSIKLNLLDVNAAATARKSSGFGGSKGGKKGGMGGLILAVGAMMKGTLFALALGALAALAGKALMTGLISLMLSAIIGVKSLAGSGHKQTTYEVVSKPIYSHSNTHSASHEEHGGYSGGYSRSFDTPLPLGLQPGYKP